jgi:glycerate kinase
VRVVLCPGVVGTLGPAAAARAMASGWRRRAADDVRCLPLSDGDEGLIEALHATLGGELVGLTVPGPLGRPTPATILLIPGSPTEGTGSRVATAVVEAGHAVGPHVAAADERSSAALVGTSDGLGWLLDAALATGAGRIIVGAGIGAVHDAGAGLLHGLGLPARRLAGGAAALAEVSEEDLDGLSDLRARLAGRELLVACATDDPLVGVHGAGAALPRRTGLDAERAQRVDRDVARFAQLVAAQGAPIRRLPLSAGVSASSRPGSAARTGVAGGSGVVLEALGARLVDGATLVAGLIGLDEHLDESALAVTACTVLDEEAVHSGVVAAAGAAGLRRGAPVVALAREVTVSRRELAGVGVVGCYALVPAPGPFSVRPPGDDGGDEGARLEARTARLAVTWSRG